MANETKRMVLGKAAYDTLQDFKHDVINIVLEKLRDVVQTKASNASGEVEISQADIKVAISLAMDEVSQSTRAETDRSAWKKAAI